MNTKVKDKKIQKKLIDVLPEEGIQSIKNLNDAFKVYFKNQSDAGDILKVRQVTMSRYLTGISLMPLEVAQRFEEYTKGAIPAKTIFFDYNAYLFDQKKYAKQRVKKQN